MEGTDGTPVHPATEGAPSAFELTCQCNGTSSELEVEKCKRCSLPILRVIRVGQAAKVERVLAELGRESGIRRNYYPKLVRRQEMTQAQADERRQLIADAIELIREAYGASR